MGFDSACDFIDRSYLFKNVIFSKTLLFHLASSVLYESRRLRKYKKKRKDQRNALKFLQVWSV